MDGERRIVATGPSRIPAIMCQLKLIDSIIDMIFGNASIGGTKCTL